MKLVDPTKIDPSRIPDDAWEFEGFTPCGTARTFIFWVDRENGTFFRKKENVGEQELIALNQQQFNDSQGKRFGNGQSVARMPMNVFYRDFAPRLREGDREFAKWWLNRDENRPYRNFRGKF